MRVLTEQGTYLTCLEQMNDEEPHLRSTIHQKELKSSPGDGVGINAGRRGIIIPTSIEQDLDH